MSFDGENASAMVTNGTFISVCQVSLLGVLIRAGPVVAELINYAE